MWATKSNFKNMIKCGFIIILAILLSSIACRKVELIEETDGPTATDDEIVDLTTYPDWTDDTHSDLSDPDYAVVFNQTEVLRFDIEISSTNWNTMQNDLSSNIRNSGGRPGEASSSDYTPVWVECSLIFNNKEWYHVGIRYKGNSSLRSTYNSGNSKFSFKLDFDEFEEDYPDLENQRFYGFKQLNLNNNYDDASLMREKIGADLFREFGLVASQTAFCVVYINNGSGPQYYGVYALVEEVDDTVLESQFDEYSGNLYKPDGNAATFAYGAYNSYEMQKKTNEELNDYSDVQSLYDIINDDERTSNTEAWKSSLENVLNINGFLKWLAANTVIQNWDTYGRMSHNYYLYNNPESGKLTWIPWDNNEAFQYGKQGGALSLSLNEVGAGWPLISYIINDAVYKQTYETYLQQFIDEVFNPDKMIATYDSYYELLKDFAYAEENGFSFISSASEFDQAVATLKTHVQSRNEAVTSYLN